MSNPPVMTSHDWFVLAVLALLWGASFLFFKLGLEAFAPLTLATLRVAIAGLVLIAIASLRGLDLAPLWRRRGAFLVAGALNATIPFALIAAGEQRIDTGIASIVNATTPMFSVIATVSMGLAAAPGPRRVFGLVMGFVGVGLVFLPAISVDAVFDPLGLAACLASSVLYGFGGAFAQRFRDEAPLITATGTIGWAALLGLPFALVIDRPWNAEVAMVPVLAVSAQAIVSTAIPYILFFGLLPRVGAVNASLVTFLVPICGVLIGVLVLGERPEPMALIGLLVILGGLAVLDGRVLRWVGPARS